MLPLMSTNHVDDSTYAIEVKLPFAKAWQIAINIVVQLLIAGDESIILSVTFVTTSVAGEFFDIPSRVLFIARGQTITSSFDACSFSRSA